MKPLLAKRLFTAIKLIYLALMAGMIVLRHLGLSLIGEAPRMLIYGLLGVTGVLTIVSFWRRTQTQHDLIMALPVSCAPGFIRSRIAADQFGVRNRSANKIARSQDKADDAAILPRVLFASASFVPPVVRNRTSLRRLRSRRCGERAEITGRTLQGPRCRT